MSQVAVVGVGESAYGKVPDRTALQLHADAATAALDDAGVAWFEVDGLFSCGASPDLHVIRLAEYLGIQPTYVDSTLTGGGAWETLVEHAAAAIETGRCETALVVYGSTQRSDSGRRLGTGARGRATGPRQFEVPYGVTVVAEHALAAMRHGYVYGTTPQQLAQVAVTTREHAAHNPRAMYQDPLTVDEVLESRLIADPLHLLDCCVISDGGGAVVLTSAARARSTRKGGVQVLGTGTAVSHMTVAQMDDLTDLPARRSGELALGQAGISPEDVDVAQLYDSFTITVLLTLEALGFCEPGESGPFVESGGMAHGGRLPTNTDGGGLSSNHPGMRGVFLLIEAVRQLRGEADLQVPDAQVAVCNGTGGFLSACGTVVLGAPR